MDASFRTLAAHFCAFAFLSAPRTATSEAPWDAVDKALGQTGKTLAGDVHRYSWPRQDLEVTMGGVRVEPALALGSWAGFKMGAEGHAMAMGDLVLLAGRKGSMAGRVLQVGVPRAARIEADSAEVPPSQGMANSMNFQSRRSSQRAADAAPAEVRHLVESESASGTILADAAGHEK